MERKVFTIIDHVTFKQALELGTVAIESRFIEIIRTKSITDFDADTRNETLLNLFTAYASLTRRQIERSERVCTMRENELDGLYGLLDTISDALDDIKSEIEAV